MQQSRDMDVDSYRRYLWNWRRMERSVQIAW